MLKSSRAASSLARELRLFSEQVKSLRLLTEELAPHIEAMDAPQKSAAELIEKQAPALSPDQIERVSYGVELIGQDMVRRSIAALGREEALALFDISAETSDIEAWLTNQIADVPEEVRKDVTVEAADDGRLIVSSGDRAVTGVLGEVLVHLNRKQLIKTHAELHRRSMLAIVIASFDVLVGAIAKQQYSLHPGSMGGPDVPLKELLAYESIDEAIEVLVDAQVENFVRGRLDGWDKAFQSWFKISLSDCALDWADLVEVFERRNLIVHTGGRVSRQYLAKMAKVGKQELPQLNEEVEVSRRYLDDVLEAVECFGVALCLRVADRLLPDDAATPVISTVQDVTFSALINRRSRLAEKVSHEIVKVARSEQDRLYARVNAWIARAQLEGLSSVQDEVQKWDVSAMGPMLKMARAALLEEDEESLRLIRECAAPGGELSARALVEWPIFQWLREKDALQEVLSERFGITNPPADFREALATELYGLRDAEDGAAAPRAGDAPAKPAP